jgi:hypothetical protein
VPKLRESRSQQQGTRRSARAFGIAKAGLPLLQQNGQHAAHLVVGQAAAAIVQIPKLAVAVINRELPAGTRPHHSFAMGHGSLRIYGVTLLARGADLCRDMLEIVDRSYEGEKNDDRQ